MKCTCSSLQWPGTHPGCFHPPSTPFSSYCSSLIHSDTWPFLKHHTISLLHLHNSPQIYHIFSLVLEAHYSLVSTFLPVTKFWQKLLRALSSSCNISLASGVRVLVFGTDFASFCSFGLLFLNFEFIASIPIFCASLLCSTSHSTIS